MNKNEIKEDKKIDTSVFEKFLNNIISLIDSLEQKDKKNNFLKELMKTCYFTKEEFYSANENNKIDLLCSLYEKKKIEKVSEDIEKTLNDIFIDIDKEEISKRKIEEFLKNSEEVVKRRLGLMKLIVKIYSPENAYDKLKKILKEIKNDIKVLTHIKSSLSKFHREKYQNELREMADIINKLENIKIKDYKDEKFTGPIRRFKNFEVMVNQIDLLQNFLLFEVIYENTRGKDKEMRFRIANEKLEEIKELFIKKGNSNIDELYKQNRYIFDIIKERLSNDEIKIEKFIKSFTRYFNILENKELIDDLTIFFKSKKYEYDLKRIIYFFNHLNKDDEWIKNISKKYEKLSEMNLKELKSNLLELKNEGIYDYQTQNKYSKIFYSLYDKKYVIDFLLSKNNKDKDINELYERIDSTNQTMTIQKIDDAKKCIEVFNKIMSIKNNKKIFEYIKTLKNDEIKAFESFSKIYSLIIELDAEHNFESKICDEINNIIKKAEFLFFNETEKFFYGEKNIITLDELIHLKNKINIVEEKKDISIVSATKKKKLLFYKNLVNNMEIIYENIKILRNKGNNLPIDIKIIIEYDKKNEAVYYLAQKESSFEQIETFLLNSKNDYIMKLDSAYKEKKYIRFLYGKLFVQIVRYLDYGDLKRVTDICRYILNKNNDEEMEIKTGIPVNLQINDYIENYGYYNNLYFNNISNYLISLFYINNTSIQKLYESMLILEKNKYKGIYLLECEENSVNKFIYELFLQKIGQKPIAQNILIANKGTSIEEIQSFLYRAILCDYNTLFVVEINESLPDYQQRLMSNFLDKLLMFKMNKYKECNKGTKVEKEDTKDYLDSCIVFVYDNKKKDLPFVYEILKLNIHIDKNINDIDEESETQPGTQIDNSNIIVITSDFCGLGKTFKIKKMIEEKNQKYFYFPLGGVLTKEIITTKLLNVLEQIKYESEKDNNINNIISAIHLDLTESEEINLINEFLFSFLITKFYNNNETVVYIPKNIEIYIEIPNCFEDYLSKFSLLKMFHIENISLDNKPKLNLPNSTIKIFDKLLGLNSNESIEKQFLEKYLDNQKKYSYHQIVIFIKLFISQFNKFNTKIKFIGINSKGEKKDITEEFIRDFAESTKYFINNGFQRLINEKIDEEKLKKQNMDYVDLLSKVYESDLRDTKYDIPLFFINKEKMVFNKLTIPNITDNRYKGPKEYLLSLKQVFNIPNDVETEKGELRSLLSILSYKSDNYVITNDKFKKMILLYYRIIADIPVILMGEVGCGKGSMIIKLNQFLNNGEKTLEIINIHPGITNEYLCEKMEEMNKKAEGQKKELWILFDDINTYSLSLFTELFSKKTFNGKKLNDNIRLIGTCNPYRKRRQGMKIYDNRREYDNNTDLVYLVQPLSQSLLNYVFSFGSLDENEEEKYIYIIIERLFNKDEEKLHETTKNVLFNCHKFLRNEFEPSFVSLKALSIFIQLVEFFKKYFTIKRKFQEMEEHSIKNNTHNNEKFDKILSIIISVYLCYYIRLNDEETRFKFNIVLRENLIALTNSFEDEVKINEDDNNYMESEDLSSKVNNKILKAYIKENSIRYFSDFLRLEEEYLLDKIELLKGIGKNDILKENVFLMFVAVNTKIPLILVGKSGTGKSLSAQLIYNSMRGEYSKNKFFKEFPMIILTYFQGTESTKPEDIEKLFDIAKNKLNFFKDKEYYKNKLPISMILFDRLDLSDLSESNPLRVLHSKLDYIGKVSSFIGLSDYSLNKTKIGRGLYIQIPNLEERLDQLIATSYNIVESISDNLSENKIFDILSRAYYEYKRKLRFIKELMVLKQYNETVKKIDKRFLFEEIKMEKAYKNLLIKERRIKEDFHSIRDFFNYIRKIAIEVNLLASFDEDDIKAIINNSIERNFGGIDYEIDISLDLELDDIRQNIETLKDIFEMGQKSKNNEQTKAKVNSVFLFKKIYNKCCDDLREHLYKLKNKDVNKYNITRCLIDNINDIDSRYLLLEINSSLAPLINQYLRILNPHKEIVFMKKSPFVKNNNNEYNITKLREILQNADTDKLIIMQDLNQIQPFLYDIYNRNYIINNGKKYARICFDNFNETLIPINDFFRIILLVDRRFMNVTDYPFLQRFEKIKITFGQLINNEQKMLTYKIIREIGFKEQIKSYNINSNFNLKDLLINSGEEDIQCLVYYEMEKSNNKLDEKHLKEIIYNKIVKISSQDIISILPEGNKIRELYLNKKKYYNLNSYINDLNEENYKISIIYTFNHISDLIENIRNENRLLISNINKENELQSIIQEIKYRNDLIENKNLKNNVIFISFEQYNSDKIHFVSEYIKKNYKEDGYKYIFIIHIQRNFGEKLNGYIHTIPDIDPDIDQLFIDNLNGPNINFKDILKKNIKEILSDNSEYIDLNDAFNKIFLNFQNKELIDNYFKEKIISKAKYFFSQVKSNENNSLKLIIRMLQNGFINKNSLDIILCLFNYIQEEIFGKLFKYILNALEDNKLLTNLINNSNEIETGKIRELLEKFLEELTYAEKEENEPIFPQNDKKLEYHSIDEEDEKEDIDEKEDAEDENSD